MTHKIITQIGNLKNHIKHSAIENPQISTVSVGWHIEHTLAVLLSTTKLLAASNPVDYKPTFSLPKLIVLTTGNIPRGKAKAPASVCPVVVADHATLLQKIEETTSALSQLVNLPANHYFNHPFFGHLNIKSYKKFVFIHSHHHLKIIKDLLKN